MIVVVLFHLCRAWPEGGFLGVDIFFALSGFLITTLLLQEARRTGDISLRSFAVRRALRLYPALVAIAGVSLAYSILARPDIAPLRHILNTSAVLLYVANFEQIADSTGWFGGLPHTWSLAIEVHFYLLWSLTVAWVVRRNARPARQLLLIALGTAAASWLWRVHLWHDGAVWLRLYLGTDTRLDGLFLGSAAACWRFGVAAAPRAADGRIAGGLTALGAFGVILALVSLVPWQEGGFPHWVGFAAAGAATSLLILVVVDSPNSIAARALGNPVFAWFGRISYSLYLWHVPVLKALSSERLEARGVPMLAAESIRVALCVVVALGSYYVVERGAMALGSRLLKRRARPSCVVAVGTQS